MWRDKTHSLYLFYVLGRFDKFNNERCAQRGEGLKVLNSKSTARLSLTLVTIPAGSSHPPLEICVVHQWLMQINP